MSGLPLRSKVALWSALVAGGVMAVALFGINYYLRFELMAVIDRRMDRDVDALCFDLDRKPGGPAESRSTITEDLVPESLRSRLIEIRGRDRRLMYRSANLGSEILSGGPAGNHELSVGNSPFRVGTYFHKSLTIHIGYPLANHYATLQRVDVAILVALPAVILVCLAGGMLVGRRALEPVRRITQVAKRITAEDLHRRLPLPEAEDEIRTLTEVLNDTFSRLETSYGQAIRFASDASHQLKTPIAVMRAGIEDLLRDQNLKPNQVEELADLLQQTRRLTSLADALLLLAKADAGRLGIKNENVDLTRIVEACAEDGEILAERSGVRIETELPGKFVVLADPMRVEHVILNLIENAVKYNRPRGFVRITAGTDEEGPNLIVANTGEPIPGEKMPHIFDRFTRGETDETRGGHGLGLSIARELARAQGGDLILLRSDQEITEFQLRLRAPAGKNDETPAAAS